MITEEWLRALVRRLRDEQYQREFPNFTLAQIKAGLRTPPLETPPTLEPKP